MPSRFPPLGPVYLAHHLLEGILVGSHMATVLLSAVPFSSGDCNKILRGLFASGSRSIYVLSLKQTLSMPIWVSYCWSVGC